MRIQSSISLGTTLLLAIAFGGPASQSQNAASQADAVCQYVITNKDINTGAARAKETAIRRCLWDHWIQQAIRENSKAASDEFYKHCDASKVQDAAKAQ